MTQEVAIVGLGALGSHVALALRNVGILRIIDFDTIESKNVLAQFHVRTAIRKNKATSLADSLRGLFGVSAVQKHTFKVTEHTATSLLTGVDLVIDCTDNAEARNVLRAWCNDNDIPLLHGAMSGDGTFAQIAWMEDFSVDAETGTGATCEDGVNLPFHVLVGSLLALTAQNFLTNGKRNAYRLGNGGSILRV